MYDFKINGKVFTSKFVVTGPSSYEKRIYRAAVSQRLRGNGLYGTNGQMCLELDIGNFTEILVKFGSNGHNKGALYIANCAHLSVVFVMKTEFSARPQKQLM